MTVKEKKEAISTWAVVIIIGHIIGYCYDYMGLDELIPCIIGYGIIWGILMSVDFSEGVNEGVSEGVKKGINVEAVEAIGKKFEKINKYIEEGKEIPAELTKNFITFPLKDDPYKDIE